MSEIFTVRTEYNFVFWKNDLQTVNNTVMWCNSSPTDLMKIRTYIVFSHNPWDRLVNIMKQANSKRADDECFEGRAVSNVTLYSYAFVMWQLGIHTSCRASVSYFATMARAHLWIALSKCFFEWVNYTFKQIKNIMETQYYENFHCTCKSTYLN